MVIDNIVYDLEIIPELKYIEDINTLIIDKYKGKKNTIIEINLIKYSNNFNNYHDRNIHERYFVYDSTNKFKIVNKHIKLINKHIAFFNKIYENVEILKQENNQLLYSINDTYNNLFKNCESFKEFKFWFIDHFDITSHLLKHGWRYNVLNDCSHYEKTKIFAEHMSKIQKYKNIYFRLTSMSTFDIFDDKTSFQYILDKNNNSNIGFTILEMLLNV